MVRVKITKVPVATIMAVVAFGLAFIVITAVFIVVALVIIHTFDVDNTKVVDTSGEREKTKQDQG